MIECSGFVDVCKMTMIFLLLQECKSGNVL